MQQAVNMPLQQRGAFGNSVMQTLIRQLEAVELQQWKSGAFYLFRV
jgi:hypothetical protein